MRYVKAASLAAAAVVLSGVFACALAQPARADVSFDVAYSNLSHHGSWLVSAEYGRVWQPSVYTREWSPYYDGHWVYTDMGWTWVSDYEWGAIPYHYGTWVSDSESGWVWIPGSVWAPAWVVFRTDSDYIGWAPVPPHYSVGVSIDMGEPSSFVFVSSRDFLSPRIRTSIIPAARTRVFINHTTVVNNIVVRNNVVINRGPDYRTVERATGRTIREARIESVARVSPFQHASRAQLAVRPERVKRGLRAADVVPASRPLPRGDRNVAHEGNTSRGDGSKGLDRRRAGRLNTQNSEAPSASDKADVQQRNHERAAADAQKVRPAQRPPRGAAPAPSAEGRHEADTRQRTHERAEPRPPQRPPRVAPARPSPEGRSRAKPERGARPQPKPRAKPPEPSRGDKPDKGPDRDTAQKPKDGANP